MNQNLSGKASWRSSPSYLGEDAAFRSGVSPAEWDKWNHDAKLRRIAYLRARDVMDAWDSVPEDDKKKWLLRKLVLAQS